MDRVTGATIPVVRARDCPTPRRSLLKLLAALAILVLLTPAMARAAGSGRAPLEAVPSLDLQRYTGTWYEIARLPNRFQTDCAGNVTAEYTLLENGRLEVVNACLKKSGEREEAAGVARLADDDGPPSKLKVRFAPWWLSWLPFVWGDYWVIDLDPEYRHAVVGTPDRKYLWVLSREPQMDEATYEAILARAVERGFDVSRMKRTMQGLQAG